MAPEKLRCEVNVNATKRTFDHGKIVVNSAFYLFPGMAFEMSSSFVRVKI